MPPNRAHTADRVGAAEFDAALERARGRAAARREAAAAAATATFRATVEARLKALEAELAEVKGRLNGLLFLLAGAVLVQIALRLLRL
ncbi:MAG TPA: hypothetical protein VFD32_08595 [Dehalococcoidia bacterium]|nr:hypothetical protein [Dehalococcoidia bacterium]